MSKLQNDFTTREQSKRLLELGVPADSADCIAHIVDNSIDLYEDFFLKGDVRISVINEDTHIQKQQHLMMETVGLMSHIPAGQ